MVRRRLDHLPAVSGTGPAVRAGCRPVGPGQPGRHRGHPGRPDIAKWGEMQKKYADEGHPMSKVDITTLFYDEERADVAEWLAARGWKVQGHTLSNWQPPTGWRSRSCPRT